MLVAFGALLLLLPALSQAQEQGENHAALVIRHGDGRVVTACVAFPEPEITGLQLLQRSGINMITQGGGIGAAVCKLDNEGCDYPTEDCFCKRDGPKTIYWAYNRLMQGKWMLSTLGASNTRVRPGDVEGWAWGSGDVQSGAVPPLLTFDQICALAAGGQQPSPKPTRVPQPTPPPATKQPRPTTRPTAAPSVVAQAPTDAPTRAPSPTSIPTEEPTSAPSPAAAPTSPAATNMPTNMPTALPTGAPASANGEQGSMLSYVVFAVAALALVVGIAITARRR